MARILRTMHNRSTAECAAVHGSCGSGTPDGIFERLTGHAEVQCWCFLAASVIIRADQHRSAQAGREAVESFAGNSAGGEMGLRERVRARVGTELASVLARVEARVGVRLPGSLGGENRPGSGANPRQSGGGSASSGPIFSQAGAIGLPSWLEQVAHLEEVGSATVALFQARFTEAELAVRDALDALEAFAHQKLGPTRGAEWHTQLETLLKLWQDQNLKVLEVWRNAFARSASTWRALGEQVSGHPWQLALGEAAKRFDTVWLEEWENIQRTLDEIALTLKAGFEGAALTAGASSVSPAVWQRALSHVDGGIRRAQGDLWGAWGTQAALIRGCSRKVIEAQGDIPTLYVPTFDQMTADFASVIRANVIDLRDSWLEAVKVLRQGIEASP